MRLRKVLAVVIFAFLLIGELNSGLTAEDLAKYGIATLPTPVLHTPDFPDVFGGKDGSTLRLDEDNQIKGLELSLFPKQYLKLKKSLTMMGG